MMNDLINAIMLELAYKLYCEHLGTITKGSYLDEMANVFLSQTEYYGEKMYDSFHDMIAHEAEEDLWNLID